LKNNRPLFLLLIAIAVGVWIVNAYTIAVLIAPHATSVPNARRHEDDVLLAVFNRAGNALKCRPRTDAFTYDGNFENPFRLLSEAFASPVKKKTASSSTAQITLTLKGVLLKERPLAILEDGSGKTFICGIGEKIQELVVESIEPNRVTLRGSQGAYTLSVKE
jgi:hypothetical protein